MPIAPIDPPATSDSPLTLPDIVAISVGTTANDGTGDTIRAAFGKVNTALGQILGTLAACAPQSWQVPGVQSADYDASVGSFLIRMDATAGNRSVNLPPAADVIGQCIEIVKWDSSGNIVTPVSDGTDTIYASGSTTLSTQYATIRLRAISGGWVKV